MQAGAAGARDGVTGRGSRVPGVAVATKLRVPGECCALRAPPWLASPRGRGKCSEDAFSNPFEFLVLPSWVYSGFRSFLRQHSRTVWPLNKTGILRMTLNSNHPVSDLDYLSCFPRPLINETFLKFYFLLHLVSLCSQDSLGSPLSPFTTWVWRLTSDGQARVQ